MSLETTLQRIALLRTSLNPIPAGAVASSPAAPAGASAPGSFAGVLAQAPAAAGPVALPATAASRMTAGQQRFAGRLAVQTGLHPQVIAAWMLAEESGSAAVSREQSRNHNWLNIGWTDRGRYGTTASIWSDPISAADATAGWLRGQRTVPGYGAASPGVQSILRAVGQPPEAQIAALQRSGWASSGYPILPGVYRSLSR